MRPQRTDAGDPDLRRRVLILEDDREIAQVIALTLEEAGFDTQVAAHGAEALALVDAGVPDVIVLDLLLGNGMTGSEFLEQARARGVAAAVVVVSGSSEGLRAAREIGAQHLMKPFDLDELVAAVEAAVAAQG